MFSTLFSSAKIGTLVLKNRLVVAPMDTSFGIPGDHGRVTAQHIAYFTEKARGGWGLIIVEANAVIERNNAASRDMDLCADEHIEGHSRLVAAVHENGSKICAQLCHSGRQSSYNGEGFAPFAPSPIADPVMGYTPTEISLDEIHALVKAFGDAALRAKAAGYDAVEIHGAHGYLLSEFLSPYANKRTDEYGGTLEGRAKISLEVVREIKARCGAEFPVLFRLSMEDGLPNGEGLCLPETLAFAMMLEQVGVDAIDASFGNYTSIQYMIPPAAVPRGFSGKYSAELKKVVDIPVIHVGRYTDPYIAEAALCAGRCDFIAMGRQSLADPEFPQKAESGKVDDIRRCIGCQAGCVENLWKGAPIHCAVNPRIGYESDYQQIAEAAPVHKDVVVVGGGVGGMEAAISAAERGHSVTLYESGDRLGGQFNLACVPPYKQELSTLVSWQKRRLDTLGVKVVLHHEVTAEELLAAAPDEVILATGARPAKPPFEGIEQSHVFTQAEVLRGTKTAGENVAVIGGGDVGCETAAFLASMGKHVAVFEMMGAACAKMERSVKGFLKAYLEEKGVQINLNAKVLEIREDAILYEQNGEEKTCAPIDSVVIAVGSRPYNPLEEALQGKVSLHVLGDAAKARRGIDAVQEGYRIGKTI